MRRPSARGRIFPQYLSTDRRIGRLSLKAVALFPLMWTNSDDQGRISGDPEEVKYAVCPNVDHISKTEVEGLIQELHKHNLLLHYQTSNGSSACQMVDWWAVQKLQWAWPSDFPPPDGWLDRLRYKKGAKEVETENWGGQLEFPGTSFKASPETSTSSPLTIPLERETEEGRRRGSRRGRGSSPDTSGERSPDTSGETPSASPADLETVFENIKEVFSYEWGRVSVEESGGVVPREVTAKEEAQLRDLATELLASGKPGALISAKLKPAFNEAGALNKRHISYVRKILLAWLDIEPGEG